MFTSKTYSRILFLLSSFLITQNAVALINTQIDTSRLSGVAPLAVFFDATATTSTSTAKPFHELHYAWDFGDTGAGTWRYGNASSNNKNKAYGAVAAHVFERPGTYTVTLNTKGTNGDTHSDTVTITVTDPDAVFSGNNTVCFSTSGDFSGCPAGAKQVMSSSTSSIASHVDSNKRLLLRKGETWNGTGSIKIQSAGPSIIGSYGAGISKPKISRSNGGNIIGWGHDTGDWRIMDIEFQGGSNSSSVIATSGQSRNNLIMRTKATPGTLHSAMEVSGIRLRNASRGLPQGLFIVENHWDDFGFGRGGNSIYMVIGRLAILGNYLNDTKDGEHLIRLVHAEQAVVSNNYMGRQATAKGILALRNNPEGSGALWSGNDTHDVIVSDNEVYSNAAHLLGGISSNDGGNETPHGSDVIFERNYLAQAPEVTGKAQVPFDTKFVDDMTIRNNVIFMKDWFAYGGSRLNGNRIYYYNNTCYSPHSGPIYCANHHGGTNLYVSNNMVYAPNATNSSPLSGLTNDGSNLLIKSPNPFTSSSFDGPEDFNLSNNSALNDSGVSLPVYEDYRLTPRAGGYGIGAYGAGGGSPVHQCSDGVDNDGDTLVDFPEDPGCSNSTDNDETNSVLPPTPTVSLGANPSSITLGSSSTLTWSTTNAVSCVKEGGWSGAMPLNGSEIVSPSSNSKYTVTCTNSRGDVASSSIDISVAVPADGDATFSLLWFSGFENGWPGNEWLNWAPSGPGASPGTEDWSIVGPENGVTPIEGSSMYKGIISGNSGDSHRAYPILHADDHFNSQPYLVDSFYVWLDSNIGVGASNWISPVTWSTNPSWGPGLWTLSIREQSNGKQYLELAHLWNDGGWNKKLSSTADNFPKKQWVRFTTYTDFTGDGYTRIWMNGTPVFEGGGSNISGYSDTLSRAHWGMYTGSAVNNGVMYNDSIKVWGLSAPLANLDVEPQTSSTNPSPTISLSANPATITEGSSSTITWSSTNTDTCVASGGWGGGKNTSGSQNIFPSGNTSYQLTCTGTGGNASANVLVTVILPLDTSPPSTPGNTVSSNTTHNSTRLSWDASTDNVGVTAYNIYRNGVLSAATPNTSSQVTGLSANTIYNFTVSARDASGNESNQSFPLSVETLEPSSNDIVNGNFSNWKGSDGYTIGSGRSIKLSIDDAASIVNSVVFQVWSHAEGVESAYRATSGPYAYSASLLDKVSPGTGKHVQALLLDISGNIVYRVSERTTFMTPLISSPKPAPKTDGKDFGLITSVITKFLLEDK